MKKIALPEWFFKLRVTCDIEDIVTSRRMTNSRNVSHNFTEPHCGTVARDVFHPTIIISHVAEAWNRIKKGSKQDCSTMTVNRSIQLNAQFEMSAQTCFWRVPWWTSRFLSPYCNQSSNIFICKRCQQLAISKNICKSLLSNSLDIASQRTNLTSNPNLVWFSDKIQSKHLTIGVITEL